MGQWYKSMPDPRTQSDAVATIEAAKIRTVHARGQVRRTHGSVYSPYDRFRIDIEERKDGVLQCTCRQLTLDGKWKLVQFYGEGFANVRAARDHADEVMYSGKWPTMNALLAEENTFYGEDDGEEV